MVYEACGGGICRVIVDLACVPFYLLFLENMEKGKNKNSG